MTEATIDRPTTGAEAPDIPTASQLEERLEAHRTELTAYCYRILGSAFEAEDAVQETFVRAWRNLERFEGRSSFRSWLYKIATNVCLDMKGATQRRARPIDLNPALTADTKLGDPLPNSAWVEPVPDERTIGTGSGGDPADIAQARESIRLAFVAALQHLPPKQRAVLILREVLRWKAEEVAELLETSTASVNSALQRARATLATKDLVETDPTPAILDDEHRSLLERYVAAFEQYDMDALTALLNEDARWSMPPYELWLRTNPDIVAWCLGPGIGCRGSKLIPINVNGSPGFAQYKPDPVNGGLAPWSVQVLELEPDGRRIAGITFFLDTQRFFPLFGLPDHLDG
jgi:RNA polymerase sigma-70 factor (ECF subfamily)